MGGVGRRKSKGENHVILFQLKYILFKKKTLKIEVTI
jgi:hypothetical protein